LVSPFVAALSLQTKSKPLCRVVILVASRRARRDIISLCSPPQNIIFLHLYFPIGYKPIFIANVLLSFVDSTQSSR